MRDRKEGMCVRRNLGVPGTGRGRWWRWRRRTGAAGCCSRRPCSLARSTEKQNKQLLERRQEKVGERRGPVGSAIRAAFIGGRWGGRGANSPRVDLTQTDHRVCVDATPTGRLLGEPYAPRTAGRTLFAARCGAGVSRRAPLSRNGPAHLCFSAFFSFFGLAH